MYTETAKYYDLVYGFKDYRAEVDDLLAILRSHGWAGGGTLLDVACGTGRHLEHLRDHFSVEGLDISAELLEAAAARNPGVIFHQADMIAFDLARTFDVVTCLFSAIGYVKDLANLRRAIDAMARHLAPGGLLVVEPWFTPESWHPGTVHALLVADDPELKIARVNTSFVTDRLSYFDLHYLIATPAGTEHFVERHELGLFDELEMQAAFTAAGLEAEYNPEGITGRGIWIGRRAD